MPCQSIRVYLHTQIGRIMNKLVNKITIFCFFLASVASVNGQTAYYLKSDKVTVSGTSTLHDWVSEVTKVEWSGNFTIEDNRITGVAGVKVRMPVTSIKSEKGRIMDSKTYEAFDSDKNPYVTYTLNSAKVAGTSTDYTINSTGTLSMAGSSRTIEMPVKAKLLSSGDIQLKGSYKMNMRDYKMEPPTAIMGTIKVGEELTIDFDLTISTNKTLSKAD